MSEWFPLVFSLPLITCILPSVYSIYCFKTSSICCLRLSISSPKMSFSWRIAFIYFPCDWICCSCFLDFFKSSVFYFSRIPFSFDKLFNRMVFCCLLVFSLSIAFVNLVFGDSLSSICSWFLTPIIFRYYSLNYYMINLSHNRNSYLL